MNAVKVSGPIFEGGAVVQKRVINPALTEAANKGVSIVQSFTPVRTGYARSQWYVISSDNTIANDVDYVWFLEHGTSRMKAFNILAKSSPHIATETVKAIENRIEALN